MMKKRALSLALAIILILGLLSGCGASGKRIAEEARSGVVRILAMLRDLETGDIVYATGRLRRRQKRGKLRMCL